jgi:hypothetical protein
MTIASERTRAVNDTYEFLRDLLHPKQTPGVPRSVRQRALALLRHYPTRWDIEMVVEEGSSRFGNENNPFGTKGLEEQLRGQGHA